MKKTARNAVFFGLLGSSLYAASSSYQVDTVAGSSLVGDGGPALYAPLHDAQGVATDRAGNIYIADPGDHRVRKISPTGIISTLVGTGFAGFSGDDGPATLAQLNLPYGVTVDPSGNIFIADLGNNRVRRIAPNGKITSIAFTFKSPRNVLSDPSGNIYVSEFSGKSVRRINLDSTVSTVASTFGSPAGLALDSKGALYVADSGNLMIYKVIGAVVTSVLGNSSGASNLTLPTGLALDAFGNLYVADTARIRKLTPNGTISTIPLPARDVTFDPAGNLLIASGEHVTEQLNSGATAIIAGDGTYSLRGDGGAARQARLNSPTAVAVDKNGILFIADTGNNRVRSVSNQGIITTLATSPALAAPDALALDANQNLLVADAARNIVQSSRNTLAGNGSSAFAGDGAPAQAASLWRPAGLAAIATGGFYIADTGNDRIRRVNAGGTISTVAGDGYDAVSADGNALGISLRGPTAIALTADGILFIADTQNNLIRKLTPDGQITTVAGGAAASLTLNHPRGLALDPAGTLWIADTDNHRILTLSPNGTISVAAGTGSPNFLGDGGDASSAGFSSPTGLVSDTAGNIFIADTGNNRIRKLTAPPAPIIEISNSGYAVVGSASLQAGAAAPCSLVTIFGSDASTAAISFDGNPAVTAATALGQATVQVPCSAAPPSTALTVGAWKSTLSIAIAAPSLFALNAGSGQALALNSDSTPNSEVNRAAKGSILSLYATGMGLPANAAGVIVGTATADIQFLGDAPGLIGITQINIQLPWWLSGVQPVVVVSANVASQPAVTIAIQ